MESEHITNSYKPQFGLYLKSIFSYKPILKPLDFGLYFHKLLFFDLMEVQVRDLEAFWMGFCIELRCESNGTTPGPQKRNSKLKYRCLLKNPILLKILYIIHIPYILYIYISYIFYILHAVAPSCTRYTTPSGRMLGMLLYWTGSRTLKIYIYIYIYISIHRYTVGGKYVPP